MSTLLVCSRPDTESVVFPGATAVTTPVRDTRATFGSADAHCIVSGLTTRPPCPGTITCSVSTSLGPSATITPFWSTLAMSGRSDFHVTATGVAGEPSSLSARGTTRVFSDGSRYTVGGSIRITEAGPVPGGWPANGSTPPVASAGRAVVCGGALVCVPAGGAPITCTAAEPLRAPTRASTTATPPAAPVTVPSLSTLATDTLFEDQMKRTVGITLPARSNAVASRPLRSPTLTVTVG